MASNTESSGAVNISGYTVDILQQLGHGGFGTVFKGYNEAKDVIAVKRVVIGNQSEDRKNAIAEAVKFHFLKDNVHNDHVIKVYDVKRWKDSMWIMMDFCDLGDLNKLFTKYHQKIDTDVKLNIMGQIARGVTFLHKKNIVHRDIKPGNILLKSTNGYAEVKLGDFGLSKILDPEDMTSAMSSNVGTLIFKAPEFWDRKPNDRLKYHRNVDVYAAGLTFVAMLQARPGSNLVPKAEGSLELFETKMAIGLAAFTRCQNKHSEIRVVVPDSVNDTPLLMEIKSIVEAMTCRLPEARLSAEEVEEKIELLARKFTGTAMTFISQFTIGEVKYPSQMCYVNGNIVICGFTPKTIRLYHEETGKPLQEWNTCHIFPYLMVFEIEGIEQLLEGCTTCKVIRGYESNETSSSRKILYEDIVPSAMCQGPNNTVLVLEKKSSIKQLRYSEGCFNLVHKFSYEFATVSNMCYCEKYGNVVLVHNNQTTLTGVALATGEVVWKHTEIQFGSPPKVLNQLKDVLTIPDGRICISALGELFVLDSKDGSIKYKLFCLEGHGCIWCIATCKNGYQQRLAFHHGGVEQTSISLYNILPERWRTLQNIIPDEENSKTNE